MKQSKEVKTFTINEISIMLGVSEKSARNKLSKLGLNKHSTYGKTGKALYTEEQLEQVRGKKRLNVLSYMHLLDERHSAPVITTYYIYESKMNSDG